MRSCLALQLVLIVALSMSCGYTFSLREGYIVNFDIATMLAPSGLLQNALDSDSVLRAFYDREPERSGVLGSGLLAFLALGASASGLAGLVALRRADR